MSIIARVGWLCRGTKVPVTASGSLRAFLFAAFPLFFCAESTFVRSGERQRASSIFRTCADHLDLIVDTTAATWKKETPRTQDLGFLPRTV